MKVTHPSSKRARDGQVSSHCSMNTVYWVEKCVSVKYEKTCKYREIHKSMELGYDENEKLVFVVLFWIHFPDIWDQSVMKVTHPSSKRARDGQVSSYYSMNKVYWVEKSVSINHEKSSRYREIHKSMELGYDETETLMVVVLFWIHFPILETKI